MIFDNMLYKININYIKKEPYTGSFNKKRYRVWKEEENIKVCIYPDIFCFDKTAEDDKIYKDFPFDKDGLNDAMAYIEETIANV